MSTPNPDWKPGSAVNSPVASDRMLQIDPAAVRPVDCYKLLIGSIVPRPIALVSTISVSGVPNLAPFSFYNGVSSKPPTVAFSVARKPDGAKKDTLVNIEATGELVVNFASSWIAEPMICSGAAFPHGVNEFEKVGLMPLSSLRVKPPRVRESPIHFECKLHKLVEIGDGLAGSATLVVAEIVLFHISESAYDKGRIKLDVVKPVGRLGGFGYTLSEMSFEMQIPEPDAL